MAGAPIEVRGAEEFKQLLGRIPEDGFRIFRGELRYTTSLIHKKVIARLKGNPLQSRTGSLAKSILPEVTGTTISGLKASVYSTAKYAPIHEYGGTVKAIDKYLGVPGGPYLNIPTADNKTAAGVMRMGAREVFEQGGHVRGRGVFLDDKLMFVLVKQVTIPARLGMRDTTDAQIQPLINRLNNALQRYLGNGLIQDPPET